MSLRTIAESDLRSILNDSATGFGYSITLTDPAQTSAVLTGLSNDIAHSIDPETGVEVSSRTASIALNINDIVAAGFGSLPVSIADSASKPWTVTFDDINGNAFTFKVRESYPDRALGIITCTLELYS